MVKQGVSKEAREKGTKGAIVGNYTKINRGGETAAAPKTQAKPKVQPDFDQQDDVPF
jgi:hypothetical protein